MAENEQMFTDATEIPKFILFGDSITQGSFDPEKSGFGCFLAHRYARRADVVNRGFSGYTTRWAVPALPHVFTPSDNVKLVTIFFGANDSCIESLNPRHHVPLPQYTKNIESILKFLREMYGADLKLLLITPPPVDVDARLRFQVERYGKNATGVAQRKNSVTKQYRDEVVSIGKKFKVPVLDLFTLFLDNKNWKTFLCDGLHFSKEGNIFVGEKLLETLDECFGDSSKGGLKITPCGFTKSFSNSGSKSVPGGMKHLLPWHDKVEDDSFEYLSKRKRRKV